MSNEFDIKVIAIIRVPTHLLRQRIHHIPPSDLRIIEPSPVNEQSELMNAIKNRNKRIVVV